MLFSFLVSTALAASSWSVDSANCVASSTNGVLRLEVASVKPLEIRMVSTEANALSYTIALDKKTSYAFAPTTAAPAVPAVPPATDSMTFWNLPRGSAAFVSFLKRESKATFVSSLGVKQVISLSGSSNAIAALLKACPNPTSDAFEKAFLPAAVATVDVTKITNAAALRDLVVKAFDAYSSSNMTQAQLNALSAQYLAQISEYEKLRSNLDKLTHDTVVRLNNKKAADQAAIDQANVEIPQLQQQVAAQETALSTANAALDAAKADIAPLLPTLKQYQNAVASAQADVDAANTYLSQSNSYEAQTEQRLQQAIDGINSTQNSIAQIESNISTLRYNQSNAQNQANQLRGYLNDASNARQRFDRRFETERRMRGDSRLSSIENDLRNSQGNLQNAQSRLSQSQSAASVAMNALRQCESSPALSAVVGSNVASNLNANFGLPGRPWPGQPGGPGGDRPGWPGRGGPRPGEPGQPDPGQPQPPQPQPPQPPQQQPEPPQQPPQPPVQHRDCSNERANADRANRDVQQAQNDLNGAQGHINDLQNQRRSICSDIDRDVQREYDRLARCEQDAQGKFNDAQNQANDYANQLARAQNTDLPQAQSALSAWQNNRIQAEADVRTAQNTVATAQRSVSSANSSLSSAESRKRAWKESSGYNAKAQVQKAAQANVDQINATLDQLDKNIASDKKLIDVNTADLANIEKQMQVALATIAQKEARSDEVQKLLAPYFAQRDTLTAAKVVTDQTFKDSQTSFAAGLPQ